MELGVLGPLQARHDGASVTIPGAKPRAILTMLGLHGGSVVSAETLIDLIWGDEPPRTAAKALQTHISSLRRALGDGFVLTEGMGWILNTAEVDAPRYKLATKTGREAAAAGDTSQAVVRFEEALNLWRGTPELPDSRRGVSEKTRWIEGHAALVEDRADALLATGRAAEIIGELEAAVADGPLRERRWAQLMLALYRAGRQGEALGAYQRARSLLADELGVDPGPELRRLAAAIVAQDSALEHPVAQHLASVTRAVTFLLTDIEGSTAAWEADADAMAIALARHDELVEQVVTSRGGRLIKTRGEGDATFSVFDRPSAAATAAIELQDAILHEPWVLHEPMRIRIALHTGEVELRDGDYFGRAVNRAARLRSLATGGQILCSGATAELVIDTLPNDVGLADLGMRALRNLPRPEHVFELRLQTAERREETVDEPLERPDLPAVLTGPGRFVGRGLELERLGSAWQAALAGGIHAMLIAGEPGVGKTRLAGEWSHQVFEHGAVVLYGRSDEDLGAPYQPFAEALRSLVPCISTQRLRGLRGVEALLPLIPGLTQVLPDLSAPPRADPDTERYALFDAVVALLELASASAPVVLILDDLHWAAKPTLLLLRHLLRFGDHTRVQIVATYRSTDLDRSHPLAAMLADLHRDGTADRLALNGLGAEDVTAYVADAGYDDEQLARALVSVTGGNPFFLIEALRHVDESGGVWDPNTLPQGIREAVSRRLSRLPVQTNKALAAAAVVGSHFAVDLVERVVEQDLVDAFDEACKAGIVIEESGGRYRFNHALVRQALIAELASVRRMRLHQRIATTLEATPGADDELLGELAYHYFECAWAGNAAKAVEYCRRAADQAMTRLAYEGAADLYDQALHALEEIDDELPDRADQNAELLVARCEALLAAGEVASATRAVSQLQSATVDSVRLAAWATCFDGQLSMLVHPERLDEIEAELGAAADTLAGLGDAEGEAKAHTVRAGCLARLGRIGDCEIALDSALTAARHAREQRRVNAVLAGAPLAALWGPNPVPRAGGRCLDVVRLLRITTESPAVEATSTRCQAVLEAFRGRAATARRMIDSARRTVNEIGLRHALLEVEQFAGIIELVGDDPESAESHLRQAYHGFRRMGLDADTAETAALLGRTCLALGRDTEAQELCTESERLAGHALKASIAWRTLLALLLTRQGDHAAARQMAESAVDLAQRTDALVDHGDACLALATVLNAAGDEAGARAAAQRAAGLYERKGAEALAAKARAMLGQRVTAAPTTPAESPVMDYDHPAVRAGERVMAAIEREAWDEFERMFVPDGLIESRRKIVGFLPDETTVGEVMHHTRQDLESGAIRVERVVTAVRGTRLALVRMCIGTPDGGPGAPADELLQLYAIDEDGRIALQVWFDTDDMDAAIAELDALHSRFEEQRESWQRLENVASRLYERFKVCFAAHDWGAITAMAADDISTDDRRRAVNSGLRHGPDAFITEISGLVDVVESFTSEVVATRGARLVLSLSCTDLYEGFRTEFLDLVEVDADGRGLARVVFDPDDFTAALAELDARYLAGEAAACADTWSAITRAFAALSRGELPPTNAQFTDVDNRAFATVGTGDLMTYLRVALVDTVQNTIYVEAVHRLTEYGAVITHVAKGISQDGVDVQWRLLDTLTVDGDLISRCEMFDEAALDTALGRLDALRPQKARRLHNAASQVSQRFLAQFAVHNWDAMAELLADDYYQDDRRSTVNAGIRRGRAAALANLRVVAGLGITEVKVSDVATRGDSLVLTRSVFSFRDQDPEAFLAEQLDVGEITSDGRLAASVSFDADDFDAAIAELDARYLAGEAADYARSWSALTQTYAAANRQQLSLTSDCVNIDHRRIATIETGDLATYIRTSWDEAQSFHVYIEAVHRLGTRGAVFTQAARGTSDQGFDAQWREVIVATFEGDLVNRCELFDETDLDAALARFEELYPQPTRLVNAAGRVYERILVHFAARDWAAIAEILAEDCSTMDRRRVVNAGLRHGRDAVVAEVTAIAEAGVTLASVTVATRGERLVLRRGRALEDVHRPDAFRNDLLDVVEIDANERVVARVIFDVDDIDAAVAELDARFAAGEGAACAHTWSVITAGYAAFNQREFPELDWENVDHRRARAFAPGELAAYMRATWDLAPDVGCYSEAVHRLSGLGAVVTQVVRGTSQEGFEAEWREVVLFTVEGGMISRCEVFDEADLDAALARFDELTRSRPALENAATRNWARVAEAFNRRDGDAIFALGSVDGWYDDRRKGLRHVLEGSERRKVVDATLETALSTWRLEVEPIAIRGSRLSLTYGCYRDSGDPDRSIAVEMLHVMEVDAAGLMRYTVNFDPDDLDAALAELEARYLAGEAADYANTWSLVTGAYAGFNQRDLAATTPDWVSIDHRRGAGFAPGDMIPYMQAAWDDSPDTRIYIAAVHRISSIGAVVTHVAQGISQDGFDAEWRDINVLTVDGNLVDRCELFDHDDLHAALARFDELS
ncbi:MULTISPECIES: BTAD domain-containing putative transcriptional regulator [unclassified Mycobacterium]|uniref:BTAD domain-containing putative transcriptional regulator n=1 Tax=unclassified Mycobacterium TaxID=2642494 RepID=UPI0038764ED6